MQILESLTEEQVKEIQNYVDKTLSGRKVLIIVATPVSDDSFDLHKIHNMSVQSALELANLASENFKEKLQSN